MSSLAAAPAVPLAPAASVTGALILLAFVWIVLYGMLRGYDASLGALLRVLANAVEDIWLVGGKLADVLYGLDSRIRRLIAFGIDEVEEGMAKLWGGLEWVVRETADALVSFGADMYYAVENIVETVIPDQVRAGTAPLDTRLDGVNKRTVARERAEAQARARGIDRTNRDLVNERLARERGIDYVVGRINSVVLPRIRAAEAGLADLAGYTRRTLTRRLSHLERYALGGTITAVAIAALTRVFPYWQCTNVRRFNRFLCRLPVGLLDDLLGLGLAVLVLQDLCRMVSLMRSAATASLPALRGLVAVVDAATECTTIGKPPALPVAATALPASENLATL